jgi:hypothetical protein
VGLLNFFGRGPLSAAKIAKMAKLAANPFAQPDVRMREMERLLDDGSELAISGLLRRFASNAQGHIADEEEKSWLEDALVGVGAAAVAPLQAYIRSEAKLTFALRALERILGAAAAGTFFLEVLQAYGPEDHRNEEAKLQLVLHLTEKASKQTLVALLPFLGDHSDDVQWGILAGIDTYLRTPAAALGPADPGFDAGIAQALGSSGRIARCTAALLADHGLAVGTALPPQLEDEFWSDKQGIVRRRTKKNPAAATFS